MTYYLKYRPQTIEELDIEEVRDSLSKIVKSGKIPHAFLFAGPKGTGKTSAARVLAKIINCEKPPKKGVPCNKCEQCKSITIGNNLDVIELDAASHRGIDDVRALREAVKLSPAKARKKVYIIDEAHMLTLEASNALLKTLEEPPSHVIFILATTNPEKLIDTIRSRTLLISFQKAKTDDVVSSLKKIVRGEKIRIDKEALEVIAKHCSGSFRDAAKILEQLVVEKKSLKAESIKEFLLKTKDTGIDSFLQVLLKKDTKEGIKIIESLSEKGASMQEFLGALLSEFKKGLLSKVGIGDASLEEFEKKDLIYLIKIFSEASTMLKSVPIEQLPIEIALIEWCEPQENKDGEVPTLIEKSTAEEKITVVSKAEDVKKENGEAPFKEETKMKEVGKVFTEVTEECWKTILSKVKPINTSIEALLRATRPIGLSGNTLTLGVFYKFHKERLEEVKNKRVFEDVVGAVLGKPIKVVCTLAEPLPKKIETGSSPAVSKGEMEPKAPLTTGGDQDIIKIAEEIFSN